MDQQVQVPIDNPNADTEWNDILRSHNIIPPKPVDPEPAIQEALLSAHQRAHDNRLEDATLSELHDLEDDEDEDFLASYRQKRFAELNELQSAAKFGSVLPLQKAEYEKEVTLASNSAFVIVALLSSGAAERKNLTESRLLETRLLPSLAAKFPEVKVMVIRAELCIPNYPERNTPTLLIYKDTEIVRQVVTLGEFGGVESRVEGLEGVLVEIGCVKEGDGRLREGREREDGDFDGREARDVGIKQGGKSRGVRVEDEDDDWD